MVSSAYISLIVLGALTVASRVGAKSSTTSPSTSPTCYASGQRCAGAPGHDFIPSANCCAPNEFCLPSFTGDWGSRCQTIASLFSNGGCYKTGERCMGAQGFDFVPWQPCCNPSDLCIPVTASNDWGFRCSSILPPPSTSQGPTSPVPSAAASPSVSSQPAASPKASMRPSNTPSPGASPKQSPSGAPKPSNSPSPAAAASSSPSPAASVSASPAPSASASPSSSPHVADKCKGFQANRKEIMDLSDSEWNAYAAGLEALRQSGVYAQFVDYHSTYSVQGHGGCYFLPWHRQLLFEFERELQKVAPGVSVPFWDWTKAAPDGGNPISQRFADDPIWSREGGAVTDGPIPNAPFKDWAVSGSQVRRGFSQGNGNNGGGGTQYTFLSSQQVNTLTQTASSTFQAMANFLEANHGTPHMAVGGNMAVVPSSPTDPVFWSHHAFVDKIWRDWQLSGNGNMFDGTMPNPTRTCTLDGEQLNPPVFGRTVRQIFEDISPCVTYTVSSHAGPTSRFSLDLLSVRQNSSAVATSSSSSNASTNGFGAFASTSSSSTSFAFSSSSQLQSYQLAAAQKKANNPALYKSQVQLAYDAYQSMVLGAQGFGVPSDVVQSAKTSYNVLSLKNGVNLLQDLPILNMDVAQIMSNAQSQVQSLMNGQGFLTMNNFASPAF